MKPLIGIVVTVLAGLFLFIGALIIYKFKNREKVVSFSISLGLIVLVILNFSHILPESIELLNNKFITAQSYAFVFLMSVVGYGLFKILDYFIPDHDHSSHTKNLKHVAHITTVALFIHNIVEGMSLYTTTVSSIKTGFIYLLGIGFHNLALGITLTGQVYKENGSRKESIKMLSILVLANFIGALISFIFNIYLDKSFTLGMLLALTFGMITYIILFELWPNYKVSKERRAKVLGLLTGGILMLLTTLL